MCRLGEDHGTALVNSTLCRKRVVGVLTRSSLGIAELYMVLAMLFRPNGLALELFDTNESDVVRAHDFIIALPKTDTKGVRIVVG
jgi:hypothetical protein